MQVKKGDKPFKPPPEASAPRTEMRIRNDYWTGVHSISFEMKVASGSRDVCVMQVFGGKNTPTTLQLRVYSDGHLAGYSEDDVFAWNILDRWIKVTVTHSPDPTGNGVVSISADGNLVQRQGRGTDTRPDKAHYFKLGVYCQDPMKNIPPVCTADHSIASYRNIIVT